MLGLALLCSCSDDDKSAPAREVAGSYAGYTVAACAYFSQTDGGQSVELTAVSDSRVNVNYESDTWGTFTVEGADVTERGGVYVLAGSGTSVMGMAGKTNEYQCEFSGTVSEGTPEFTFTVPAVMGGLTVTFHPGEAPAE